MAMVPTLARRTTTIHSMESGNIYEVARQELAYSEASPSGLVWAVNKGGRAFAGSPAGGLPEKGCTVNFTDIANGVS